MKDQKYPRNVHLKILHELFQPYRFFFLSEKKSAYGSSAINDNNKMHQPIVVRLFNLLLPNRA